MIIDSLNFAFVPSDYMMKADFLSRLMAVIAVVVYCQKNKNWKMIHFEFVYGN